MNIFSNLRLHLDTKFEALKTGQDKLRLGDQLTGRVLEVKGQGLALFDFTRMKAWAQVAFPVKKGEVIEVSVVEKGPQLKLKLLDPSRKAASYASRVFAISEFPAEKTLKSLQSEIKKIMATQGRMLELPTMPRHVQTSIVRIASHFQQLNMGEKVSELSSQLRSYIENSGAFFEKKIENAIGKLQPADREISSKDLHQSSEIKDIIKNDLKPNLFILKYFFDKNEMKSAGENENHLKNLKPLINRILEDLGLQQGKAIDAQQKQKAEGSQIITFALPLREENHSGKLRIYYAGKSKNGPKEGFKMSLLLQMEKIGDIRTDFFLLNKDLRITFYINDHKIKKIITAHADLIKKPLTEHFSHLMLDVVVSERKIEEFKIEHLMSENTSLLDLRV